MEHDEPLSPPSASRLRIVRLHSLTSLLADSVAQALGTVLAGGLLYLAATTIGMVDTTRLTALTVTAICVLPIVGIVVLVRKVPGWRPAGRGAGCRCTVCRPKDPSGAHRS